MSLGQKMIVEIQKALNYSNQMFDNLLNYQNLCFLHILPYYKSKQFFGLQTSNPQIFFGHQLKSSESVGMDFVAAHFVHFL